MALNSSSTVVVLGGTSGIGLEVARGAAAAGAAVVVASRSSESVERARAALPPGTTAQQVDVQSPAALDTLFAGVGDFDHLVYTAGDALARAPIHEYDPRAASDFFSVRLFAALDAVRAAVPHLRPGGSITLTSGAAAYRGGPGRLLGSSVSGAVIAAARSLAVELAPLRVNAVAPGVVRTPLWSGAPADAQEEMFRSLGEHTLIGRVADAVDVAETYLYLLRSDYLTGTTALVDGGSTLV